MVSFGGGGGAMPLHPLERPFTDADGVRVMSQARSSPQLHAAGRYRLGLCDLRVRAGDGGRLCRGPLASCLPPPPPPPPTPPTDAV